MNTTKNKTDNPVTREKKKTGTTRHCHGFDGAHMGLIRKICTSPPPTVFISPHSRHFVPKRPTTRTKADHQNKKRQLYRWQVPSQGEVTKRDGNSHTFRSA